MSSSGLAQSKLQMTSVTIIYIYIEIDKPLIDEERVTRTAKLKDMAVAYCFNQLFWYLIKDIVIKMKSE